MAGPTAPTTAPTAIRAGGPLLSPVRRNIIFTALVFGVLVAATGQTIVVPALPTIVAELGSTVDQSWAVTSYLLGGTVVVVVAGKLGDLLGRNRVLLGSVVVFVVGSVLCGLSQTMTMLAISRALQGVGAGAISVTAYALAAEVVPLRDRGRYQGVLGAVFGVNTVTGPLLGGWLTDYLSWRWAFWINVPVSIAVLTVAATAVPALARPPKPVIDYLGILVIAVATTALIMATSWGGTTYAWGSATIVGLLIGAAVALGFFVWLEGRAAAAILPPRLFGSPVFAVCCVLSFVVGFAMLGALTFVPIYLGYVDGASATASGLRTLPMVIGLLIASTGTGVLVGRTGRYKIFPVAGMALMAVAFLLMSQMDEWTPPLLQSLYLVVLGAGIGKRGRDRPIGGRGRRHRHRHRREPRRTHPGQDRADTPDQHIRQSWPGRQSGVAYLLYRPMQYCIHRRHQCGRRSTSPHRSVRLAHHRRRVGVGARRVLRAGRHTGPRLQPRNTEPDRGRAC